MSDTVQVENLAGFDWITIRFTRLITFTPSDLARKTQEEVDKNLRFRLIDYSKKGLCEQIYRHVDPGSLVGGVSVMAHWTGNFSYASVIGAGVITRSSNNIIRDPNLIGLRLDDRGDAHPVEILMHPDDRLAVPVPIMPMTQKSAHNSTFLAGHPGWTLKQVAEDPNTVSRVDDQYMIRSENPMYEWVSRAAMEKSRQFVAQLAQEKNENLSTGVFNRRVETAHKKYMNETFPINDKGRFTMDAKDFQTALAGIAEDNEKVVSFAHVMKGLCIQFRRLSPPPPLAKTKGKSSGLLPGNVADDEEPTSLAGAIQHDNEWVGENDPELIRKSGYLPMVAKNIYNTPQTICVAVEIKVSKAKGKSD